MFYRIQAESVNAGIYPDFGIFHNSQESRRILRRFNTAVIQVRKPVGPEMGMEHGRSRQLQVIYNIGVVVGVQYKRFSIRDVGTRLALSPVFCFIVPLAGTGTNQKTPG